MENDYLLRILSAFQKLAALDFGVKSTLLGEATKVAVRGHYPCVGLLCAQDVFWNSTPCVAHSLIIVLGQLHLFIIKLSRPLMPPRDKRGN